MTKSWLTPDLYEDMTSLEKALENLAKEVEKEIHDVNSFSRYEILKRTIQLLHDCRERLKWGN